MLEAVYSILSAHSGVTGFVSTRIYPDVLPLKTLSDDATLPAIMFESISDVAVNSQSGRSEYMDARVQVNCYATSKQTAQYIRLQVLNALERKIPGNYGSVRVFGITLINQDEEYFNDADFDGVYNHFMEFSVVHG